MGFKLFRKLILLMLVLGLVSACSDKESVNIQIGEKGTIDVIEGQITLQFYAPMAEEVFHKFFADPVSEKFPNVTLERLEGDGPEGLEQLLVGGIKPDLMYLVPGWFGKTKILDVYGDMLPLIKKYNFDLGRLNPDVRKMMETYSDVGTIQFMPENMNNEILLYNKDIIDRMAVDYPQDGMTWDDMVEMTRSLTRTLDGVDYRGFDSERFYHINNHQLSLSFVDPETITANMQTDQWRNYLEIFKKIYDIPGNRPPAGQFSVFGAFFRDQNLAMYLSTLIQMHTLVSNENPGLNWDMVTMPVFKEMSDIGTQVNTPYLAITKVTERSEEAFKVIAYLLTDEMQLERNKDGRLTVLADDDIRKQFGANLNELDNKNVAAVLKLKPAQPRAFTYYDDFVVTRLAEALRLSVMEGGKDMNTLLREQEELAQKAIDDYRNTE